MTTISQPTPLDQWRQRLGGRRHRHAQLRPLAALGYLTNGAVLDGLIEISKLVLVVLYDDAGPHDRLALRLAGYGGEQVSWGVKWGGAEQCRFFKDLHLQPMPEARGARLNANCTELLRLGMQLQGELDRHSRYRQRAPGRTLVLPRLWAGFRPTEAATITGDGPELEAESRRSRRSAEDLMETTRRMEFGMVLYPLPWVSHHWQQSLAAFADLAGYPRRQVFRFSAPAHDLASFQDAAEYDLFSSRFRRDPSCRRPVAIPA